MALKSEDWDKFRKQSLLPGGFGEERKRIWPKLLFVVKRDTSESNLEEHKDEHQIKLDTDRSFVFYPDPVDAKKDRKLLQEELRQLLVSFFRRRPRLHYFQGFHDIVTVLFLTLPSEVQLECVEKLSLHRLRDSMGPSLEPVLGLLRFMKVLLRIVDPEYSITLEESTPLPYFALSNVLTLFSHDMPTLPLVQHVFDYLLCRPPIMAVYLVTAITLSRKAEVKRLQEEGDDGMVHSLLASLPHLTDETTENIEVRKEREVLSVTKEEKGEPEAEYIPSEASEDSPTIPPSEQADEENNSNSDSTEMEDVPPTSSITSPHASSATLPNPNGEGPSAVEFSSPAPTYSEPQKPVIPLTTLLEKSDSLYQQYPPELKHKLSDIMGPQSAMFTWSENEHELPSDDSAERMVDYPQLVVYPVVEDESGGSDDEKSRVGGNKKRNRNARVVEFRDRKMMVFGAVLVLGVAMAVYSGGQDGVEGWVESVLGNRFW